VTSCLPSEDFAVSTQRRRDKPRTLIARGRLTAAGGELLYCAIATICRNAGDRLVADLRAVVEVEPAGWSWLLPAFQECQAAGCQLLILPPAAPNTPSGSDATSGWGQDTPSGWDSTSGWRQDTPSGSASTSGWRQDTPSGSGQDTPFSSDLDTPSSSDLDTPSGSDSSHQSTPPVEPSQPDSARLRCYPDGPILVRGDFDLVDRSGQCLPRTRSVVALCRCGGSAIKPFCDGSHKSLAFTDE
jgi:Iron-binding zinc finger CDGSH type